MFDNLCMYFTKFLKVIIMNYSVEFDITSPKSGSMATSLAFLDQEDQDTRYIL